MEMPPLPERDGQGNRPAVAMVQTLMARRVIRAREAMKLSRSELARRSGVCVETITRIESGRHTPRSSTISKIAQVLGKI